MIQEKENIYSAIRRYTAQQQSKAPHFTRPNLLLHPNLPMPLHGLNPRTCLGSRWWNAAREVAYRENNFCCWACGRHRDEVEMRGRLEAHEVYDINWEQGRSIFTEVTALCHFCHQFIHSGMIKARVEKGDYDPRKQDAIREHGYRILWNAGLEPSEWSRMNFERNYVPPYEFLNMEMADWEEWRLIVGDKIFEPLFANEDEYNDYYNPEQEEGDGEPDDELPF